MASELDLPARAKPGGGSRRMLYVAIACDIVIAAGKFAVAAVTGSSALLTEGVHSLVDTGNELMLLYGVRRGRRTLDEGHPFGYGKATYVWSLIVALSVFSMGGGVSVYEGVVSLSRTPVLADPTWSYFVLGFAAVFEGWSWRVSQQELERHRQVGESLWRAAQRDMDVLVYTMFVVNSAALVGIVIAALGVGLSHALHNPYLDPGASVMIGLLMIAAAALLARKSVSLLVGASLDHAQLAQLHKILAADPAVESVGHLLTMRLGPDSVLLTAKLRFRRHLDLDEVEQAIERLERAIKLPYPSIQHLYLESGALKQAARSAGQAKAATPS
ncbi:MAG: cation diffusion facilitator family transporter [Rhodoferax sp.]